MVPKRPQAPSRAKYAAVNPSRTVRFKPEQLAKIAAIRERLGGSFNEAVNVIVDGFDDAAIEVIRARADEDGFRRGVKAARSPAYAAGYAAASNLFRLTLPCSRCGQLIELRVDDTSARAALGVLIGRGMVHNACLSRPDLLSPPTADVR
jgi:hypothetical protein